MQLCNESANELGVPTALRILEMSTDGSKYKIAKK